MEQNSSFDSFELQLTSVAQGFLRETAKWATFLSIIGFIFIALLVLGGLAMMAVGGALAGSDMGGSGMGMNPFAALGGATIGIIYFVIALVYFFPIYYLYKFAAGIKRALSNNNTEELTSSLEYLKSHYKFLGIFTMIFIILYIVIIIFAVIAGVSAASGM